MLLILQFLLLVQRGLYGLFDGLDVLQSGLSLELVESNALLKQRLDLGPHLALPIGLGSCHRFLLKARTLLLLHYLVRLFLEVDQDLVFALNFLFLVDDFLAKARLEGDEMVWVPRERLVVRGGARLADG